MMTLQLTDDERIHLHFLVRERMDHLVLQMQAEEGDNSHDAMMRREFIRDDYVELESLLARLRREGPHTEQG